MCIEYISDRVLCCIRKETGSCLPNKLLFTCTVYGNDISVVCDTSILFVFVIPASKVVCTRTVTFQLFQLLL